jgi:Rrf2 family cysteine metabolism transcriptional repressor
VRFSAKEDCALRAVVELAVQHGRGPIPLSRVSEEQGISLAYLEQIVRLLRDGGVLKSTRGVRGGYNLARPPTQITVGDVLRAVDGAIVPIPCVSPQESCARTAACTTRLVWEQVLDSLVRTLDSITLSDLVDQESAAALFVQTR